MMILGVLRKRFKSKMLTLIQEEFCLNRIALERKGRGEEILLVNRTRPLEKGEVDD